MGSPARIGMPIMKRILLSLGLGMVPVAGAGELSPGNALRVTVRGISATEQEKINGDYRVDERGGVRLPYLESTVTADGMSTTEFARAVERAYRRSEIYTNPAIDVVALKEIEAEGVKVSVGGHVKRSGRFAFQKGMTMVQAIDSAGGRDRFASRNVMLIRGDRQICLDFEKLAHKNIELRPGDSLQVEQRPAIFDTWKGSEEAVKPLLE